MDDESLQKVYTWVDEIPLSRPKRNISRDFSDGGESRPPPTLIRVPQRPRRARPPRRRRRLALARCCCW
jgi:hypothetical protein